MLIAVALLAVVFREDIERGVVTALLRSATGLSIEVGSAHNVPGGVALGDVRAHSESGDLVLSATRLVLARPDGGLDVRAEGLTATAAWGSWTSPLERIAAFAQRYGMAGRETVHVRDGTLLLTGGGTTPWKLAFGDVTGTARRSGGAAAYDVTANLTDGDAVYPIAARLEVAGGRTTDRWSAAALPLSQIGALIPSTLVRFSGGTLGDVALTVVRDANGLPLSLQAQAHIEDGAAGLSGDRAPS